MLVLKAVISIKFPKDIIGTSWRINCTNSTFFLEVRIDNILSFVVGKKIVKNVYVLLKSLF